jgi:hypothetical protein
MEAMAATEIREHGTRATAPRLARPMRKGGPRDINTRGGTMLDTKLVTWTLAAWAGLAFVICVIYGLVAPESLHMTAFLEQILPGFRWLTWPGFAIGLVKSVLYGVFAGVTFCPIYNLLRRRQARLAST